MGNKYEKVMLKNIEVKFAAIIEAVENYDGDGYEYVLQAKLTDKQAENLKSKGCEKQLKDGYMKFSRPGQDSKGNELAMQVVGPNPREPFTALVGNGSVCNVRLVLLPYTFKKKKGVSFRLDAVQVLKHVPYTKQVDTTGFDDLSEEDEDTEGFDDEDEI